MESTKVGPDSLIIQSGHADKLCHCTCIVSGPPSVSIHPLSSPGCMNPLIVAGACVHDSCNRVHIMPAARVSVDQSGTLTASSCPLRDLPCCDKLDYRRACARINPARAGQTSIKLTPTASCRDPFRIQMWQSWTHKQQLCSRCQPRCFAWLTAALQPLHLVQVPSTSAAAPQALEQSPKNDSTTLQRTPMPSKARRSALCRSWRSTPAGAPVAQASCGPPGAPTRARQPWRRPGPRWRGCTGRSSTCRTSWTASKMRTPRWVLRPASALSWAVGGGFWVAARGALHQQGRGAEPAPACCSPCLP